MPSLKVAVLSGQFEYPRGLFFGGKRLEQTAERYQAFLSSRLASAERVVAFDVHTAIGDYGEDLLMVQPGAYRALRQMFGERVVPPDPKKTDSYPTTGSIDTLFARVM